MSSPGIMCVVSRSVNVETAGGLEAKARISSCPMDTHNKYEASHWHSPMKTAVNSTPRRCT